MTPEQFGASWISDHLWQSGTPIFGPFMADTGINLIISCQHEFEPKAIHYPGVKIHHCPLRDCYDPTEIEIVRAEMAANLAIVSVRLGQNVLIHCAAGLNRSGWVMGLTLKGVLGITGWQAILIIKANREGALFNDVFCKLIEKGDPK